MVYQHIYIYICFVWSLWVLSKFVRLHKIDKRKRGPGADFKCGAHRMMCVNVGVCICGFVTFHVLKAPRGQRTSDVGIVRVEICVCVLPHKVCRCPTKRVLIFYIKLLSHTSRMLLYANSNTQPLPFIYLPHSFYISGRRTNVNSLQTHQHIGKEIQQIYLCVGKFTISPKFAHSRRETAFIAYTINKHRSALFANYTIPTKTTTISV